MDRGELRVQVSEFWRSLRKKLTRDIFGGWHCSNEDGMIFIQEFVIEVCGDDARRTLLDLADVN